MTETGAVSLLIYGFTAMMAHLSMSLGQTLFHRYLGHSRLGGRFFKNRDVMIKTIMSALASGENVEINSFGKFVHVNGRRYVGRNFKTGETILKTGETIEISARRSVIFRPAKELRQVRSFSK